MPDNKAMEDLVKKCGFQDPEIVQTVSNTILQCNFHSEHGKLQVLNRLQKLDGKFVIQRVCEGLCKLNNVYPDSKLYEEESFELVDLCASQSEALRRCSDGRQVSSPLDIISWTIMLCDELMRPREERPPDKESIKSLSKHLSKLMVTYDKLSNARLHVIAQDRERIEMLDPFKSLFEALKPRVHDSPDAFDALLDQAILIIQADALLDPKMLSKVIHTKQAVLLENWISLLKLPFLSTWFVVAIAKHDFLVNDETFVRKQPFSDEKIYRESLICVVSNEMNDQGLKLSCDEKRLQIFFDHSEILLRWPNLCFQLVKSEVANHQIEEVFELLQIKRDDTMLPFISDTESKELEGKIKTFQKSLLSANPKTLHDLVGDDSSTSQSASQDRYKLELICSVVFQALFDLPDDREQLLDVLRLWRDRFYNDESRTMLFAIIKLVEYLKQQGIQKGLLKLKTFLSQLSTELLHAFPFWPSIEECLMAALPTTWFAQECNLINRILKTAMAKYDPIKAVQSIYNFVKSLEDMQVSEQVKRKAIRIGLDLIRDAAQPRHYELVLNVIGFVASDMSSGRVKKYVSDLLKAVHEVQIAYSQVWNVVRLIHNSSSIDDKEAIMHCFLKVLQDAKGESDMQEIMSACADFFRFPVDSTNAKQFLDKAALDSTIYRSILYYLWINETFLDDGKFNEHTKFLLSLILHSRIEHRRILFETVKNNIQWLHYQSVEVFETVMACVAGSLAVGTFNKEANDEALKRLHLAIRTHHLQVPCEVLSLFIVLTQCLQNVICLGHSESCTKSFAEGLDIIIMLPLPLLDLEVLITRMANILEEGKFFSGAEVANIMLHLFKLPSSILSFAEPILLASHFKILISKSCGLPIAKKLSKIGLHEGIEKSGSDEYLSEILMKKIPTAIEDGSLADVFQFVVDEFSKKPSSGILQVALPLINALVKKPVSVKAFKAKIKEIHKELRYIPPEQVLILTKCITEFFALKMHEEKLSIYEFIGVLLDLNWNVLDMRRIYENVIPLLIPKHLVSVFKDKPSFKEILEKLNTILHVASNFNPSAMLLFTSHGEESGNKILQFLAHDFNMLLNHTRMSSRDVCLSLLLYNNCQMTEILSIFLQRENVSLGDDSEWPFEYDKTKLLTPGKVSYLILYQLRRLGIQDVKNELMRLCCKLIEKYNQCCSRTRTNEQLVVTFEEYFELFILIMDKSSSLPEVWYWLNEFSADHALLFKSVIVATCSWKAGIRTSDEAVQMNKKVSAMLSTMQNRPAASAVSETSDKDLAGKLVIMENVLKKIEDEQVVCRLFNLLCISARATAACVEVLPSWNKSQSLLLVEQIERLYQEEQDTKPEEMDKDLAIVFPILPFAAKAFVNSAMELIDFFRMIIEKNGGLTDDMSLRRLPVWFKQMTEADGYSLRVIQSWCTSLLFSKTLSSSEVDAITNLTPEMIQFISNETDCIRKSLFSKDAPKTWETKDAVTHRRNTKCFKLCLLLSRILNEYIFIAHQLKDNEDVVKKIKDGTQELCRVFEDQNSKTEIYKTRDNLLHELFVLLFCEEKDRNSMMQLIDLEPLSRSLILLLRRLARSVARRRITFGHVKMVLNKIEKYRSDDFSPDQQCQLVESNLHKEVLSLDQNQACIYLLEAWGYNKGPTDEGDLWHSSSIQMSAYVPAIESIEKNRLGQLMRQLWREWRIILFENDTHEVEVEGRRIQTADMFKYSDSLEKMESQLKAIKKVSRLWPDDDWSSYRGKELMKREKTIRAKMKRQADEEEANESPAQLKLTKAIIVWDNRLLEVIKMCSEKIPGCYAPNGFHSEKPVICGIAVDNRILTVYKESKGGTRTEVENVEVKLYPAGMVVFGAYCSVHPYDTQQLWAAFYKMLLDKRLVPKIFITNVSPAFDWIKQFIAPETLSPGRRLRFVNSCGLIPASEDSYDYDPDICVHSLHTLQANESMKELIILTKEKAKKIQIRSIKPPNRNQLIRDNIGRVLQHAHFQDGGRLQGMHPESHGKILNKLKFAIGQAVEIAVDGDELTQESISTNIDMKRLLFGCQDAQDQYSRDVYSAVILDAVTTVTGDLRGTNTCYDGCQHVEFSYFSG